MTNSTFDWTSQFEIVQVASEDVFAKFGRISGDLVKKITSG